MNDGFFSSLGEFWLFIGSVIFVMFLVWWMCGSPTYHYEYIDADNNTGIADSCWSNKGTAFCNSSNTTIQVKSYTRIKD